LVNVNQNKIKKINKLLIDRFGIPPRSKKKPDPVDMLIATILSQNTNDNNSYRALQNLREAFPENFDLMNAEIHKIKELIRPAGLTIQKANAIKNFLIDLYAERKSISLKHIEKFENLEAIKYLNQFKGVGVKTASCVLLFSLNKNICPVDTHVYRTTNRIGLVNEKTPDKTFFKLNNNFPENIAHSFHTNLIRLGREICTPSNPACGICPIKKLCKFENKELKNKEAGRKRNFMLLDNVN